MTDPLTIIIIANTDYMWQIFHGNGFALLLVVVVVLLQKSKKLFTGFIVHDRACVYCTSLVYLCLFQMLPSAELNINRCQSSICILPAILYSLMRRYVIWGTPCIYFTSWQVRHSHKSMSSLSTGVLLKLFSFRWRGDILNDLRQLLFSDI